MPKTTCVATNCEESNGYANAGDSFHDHLWTKLTTQHILAMEQHDKDSNGNPYVSRTSAEDALKSLCGSRITLTATQQELMKILTDHIDGGQKEQLLLFVLGGPGVGKTWSVNTLIQLLDSIRAKGVLASAFMGSAASNIPGSGTVHRLYNIPIPKKKGI